MSEFNFDTASLEEIRAAHDAEEAKLAEELDEKQASQKTKEELIAETEEAEPEEYIMERSIDLEDGSGVQVFRGHGVTKEDALMDLADKLADAQKHATVKIKKLNKAANIQEQKTSQQIEDENYVVKQKFDKNPAQTIKELAAEALSEQQAQQAESQRVQQQFVDTHSDFIPNSTNGKKITDFIRLSGETEFTEANLEKAYQSLKADGLLVLKQEGASEPTEEVPAKTERIVQPVATTTQVRSVRKSSTISSRGSAPALKTAPSEDELYSMPLEKLKQLAIEEASKRQQ